MGILNVTPDSFSDGGRNLETGSAVETARQMVADGAGIIDIGGESTRPGADPVSPDDERARILPVFRALSAEFGPDGPLLSVDTYRAETARLALEAGAHIVNDVWGLRREPEMAKVAADAGAGIIVMHTGRERDKLPNVMADQFHWFEPSLDMAAKAGIDRGRILLDPGFGFAKDTAENVELMARMAELNVLGLPIVAGTSRKRFIGALTGREAADERDAGTAATSVLLRLAGASIFRVHDVRINRDALAIADAVIAENMRGQ
ncbi:dihydropteroate synthase [Pseudohoeflea suaedae]|uniref:dihydropteroate synthase n=1 Tax=Pseudohoeflea suaedae TaxID=877384 RepID=A0A4R5PKU4_9HYPH|nr:dihydropteroate synthase [Pseudohoeflea suaedae]